MPLDAVIERLIPGERGDEGLLQRHLAAYAFVVHEAPAVTLALDCGCGIGYGAHILARHCGPTVGLDRECEALREARRRYPGPLAHVCGDAQGLPFADGAFDLVVSSQVLEHAADPEAFCGELRRVCAPGGKAIIAVPNRLTQAPGEFLSSECHAREFGPDDLWDLLRRHFSALTPYGTFPGPRMARFESADTWARRSVARDRLGLRRLAPRGLRRWLLGRLRGPQQAVAPPALPTDLLTHHDCAYYVVTTGPLEEALDLVAVCRP
ncbi:class I SAM-dependent methyltransferase [bacterium]|nr:class I SAM-dependent methyltransferase [bacterium]